MISKEGSAPVLIRERKDSSDETLDFLKSIDDRLSDIPKILSDSEKEVKNRKPKERKEDSLAPIRESFKEFKKYISKEIDSTKLPEKYLEKYIKTQNTIAERRFDNIESSLLREVDKILSKPKLNAEDKKTLLKIDALESELKKIKPKEQEESVFIDLQKSIDEMNQSILSMNNTNNMSKKDAKEYKKIQQKQLGKKQEELQETLREEREKILNKSTLTDEDKIKLKDLQKFQKDNESYGLKDKSWLGKKFDSFQSDLGKNIENGSKEMVDASVRGLLGPLNLILEPLSDLFGIKFSSILDSITGKDKDEYTKKGKKIKPKRSDILKSNPEIVYLADEQKKNSKSSSELKKDDGNIDNIVEGAMGGLGAAALSSLVATLLPILLPALGITIGVVALGAFIAGALKNGAERSAEADKLMSDSGLNKDEVMAKNGNTQLENVKVEAYKEGKGNITASEAYKAGSTAQAGGFASASTTEGIMSAQKVVEESKPWEIEGRRFAIDKRGKDYFLQGSSIPIDPSDYKNIMSIDRAMTTTNNDQQVIDANGNFNKYYDLVMAKGGKDPKKFHSGGKVQGPNNSEIPAILKTRERVLTEKQDNDLGYLLTSTAKSMRSNNGFDSDNMSSDLSSIAESMNKNSKGNEIVSNLKILIDIMKNKDFNNLISNNVIQSQDYNRLRSALC